MDNRTIPDFSNYHDLFKKLELDTERYKKNMHSYELIDCLMTLNALPQWIIKSNYSSPDLIKIAVKKEKIMIGHGNFQFDESLISSDIDHQLRFVRLFCNHSKHGTNYSEMPKITSRYGGTLPAKFPIRFYNYIVIGNMEFEGLELLLSLKDFWKEKIENH